MIPSSQPQERFFETDRLRLVYVSPDLLVDILQHGIRGADVVENALPGDAAFVRGHYDPPLRAFGLVIHSASFAPVAAGAPIPEHPPQVFRSREEGGVAAARDWPCGGCGQSFPEVALIHGPDPFESEVHGDETPVRLCKKCHYERGRDV